MLLRVPLRRGVYFQSAGLEVHLGALQVMIVFAPGN